jgi:hypothetical protein
MTRFYIILFIFGALFSCEKEVIPTVDCTDPELCDIQNISVKNILVNNLEVLVVNSSALHFFQSFERKTLEGNILEFTPIQKSFPEIVEDQFGNIYDVFGHAVSGPDKGRNLKATHAGLGYWFAWSSTYPRITLDDEEGAGVAVESEDEEWLVSEDFVFRGAASDGIPAINEPEFQVHTNKQIITSGLLQDDDELIIVRSGETIKIYPIKILNYHEIVNDQIDDNLFSVCYAPYTGTSSVWSRSFGNAELEFGVSGLVYNNNILLFDRSTKSYWNQLLEISVNGAFLATRPKRITYFRTTWSTWKEVSNSHLILNGLNRLQFNYDEDPLGDYSNNHAYLPFEISSYDSRLKNKSLVYSLVIEGEAIAFRNEDF